ncbi:MAG: S8 family peptidase, partial [Coriobacteriia bacterium]|nr:S8 family peptidase [Coriobacteriia bacterium]
VARYAQLPGVQYAQPNYLHHIDAVPNDPRFDELWGMQNTGQTGGTVDADIDATVAWEEQTGSSDVIVAVIDTGVDYNHPDLAGNMWVNAGEIPRNMLDDDNNGFVDDVYGYDFANRDGDPIDDHSHGTHTSGTIGGVGDNGIGVSGVAQDVRIMAMKFLTSDGWGTTDAAIECIEYADMMGADIMSNSWGGGPFEQALADAIANTDALFVAAAGNDSSNTDTMPNYPSCYDSPNVVAIGATNHNDEPTWFTNYGAETVDVFAPGEEILSTVLGPAPRFTPDISSQTPVSDCSSLAGWDVSAYNNAPWALSNTEFVSAPSSFALFDYGDYEDAWIKSTTPLDLSLMSGAMLRFQAYYDTEEG